ncbi:MAG: nucleotidyltransferase domain-containing protein [Firmicutes bacterium]|nr:nucleotidyltransferase domain-containing protein [Bacillota bacterium]
MTPGHATGKRAGFRPRATATCAGSGEDKGLGSPFGSHARGKATRRSDVDVAVYFAGAHDLTPVNGVAGELEALLHKHVDLIVLNEANTSVAWAALRGIPLVVRDRTFYLVPQADAVCDLPSCRVQSGRG